ncbi:hypothetical protein BLX88_26035 [Bacillus obstructivus]|nr:hypothetical protein BLX88_26035 [Bacillus obstructivus]
MNKKYDWNSIERYFMECGQESGITLKDISDNFVIPYQSIRRYAAKHNWHSKRYSAWIKEKYGI